MDGYVAVPDRADIGALFWIRPVGSENWEKFLAVDCASFSDGSYWWMVNNNILVEIDGETAKRWNTVRRRIEIEMKRVPGYTLEWQPY